MMAAVGAFLGPRLAIFGLVTGMAFGGVVMTIHLIRIGRLREKLASLKNMILALVLTRSVTALRISAEEPGAISLPYSIPLGLGTAAVVFATAVSH
jgi:prepilin peptidase CpaA